MSRAKNWVFTLNNYTQQDEENLVALFNRASVCAWGIYGREVGAQGTPHLQGVISLVERKRLSQMRQLIPGAHFEVRRGTFDQARRYAMKDGDFVEVGSRPLDERGKRTDLEALHEDLRAKKRMRAVADTHFACFLKYQRGINAYRNATSTGRDWICSVVIYWGRTGTGKTRAVYDNVDSKDSIYVHPGGPWFDGYDGHDIVLFDDFGGSEFKLTYLLKLLDRYPMRVPIKGGFTNWVPHEIYLTSNRSIDEWFPNGHPEHVLALKRRITNTVHFE